MIFETQRLIVRSYTAADAAFVLDMYARSEVVRFLGSTPRPVQNSDDALELIERWVGVSRPNPLLGVWAVTLRDTGDCVGTVLLKLIPLSAPTRPPPLSEDHEVGWHLHPNYWGNGYATEASQAAMRRAFDAGIAEVLAIVRPDNTRSKRVAERLGMDYRGRTDRYYGMEADLYHAARPAIGA